MLCSFFVSTVEITMVLAPQYLTIELVYHLNILLLLTSTLRLTPWILYKIFYFIFIRTTILDFTYPTPPNINCINLIGPVRQGFPTIKLQTSISTISYWTAQKENILNSYFYFIDQCSLQGGYTLCILLFWL